MLIIRKVQMDALRAASRQRFVKQTVQHVRRVFAEQVAKMPVTEVTHLVEEGIRRASAYRITEKREVTLFVDLVFGLGRDFDRRAGLPWIRDTLANPELDQHEKMGLIYKRLETAPAVATTPNRR